MQFKKFLNILNFGLILFKFFYVFMAKKLNKVQKNCLIIIILTFILTFYFFYF